MFSNRDYAPFNELTLKTCFLTLLYNDLQYIMDSDPELTRRCADLTMIIRPDRRHLKIFDVLIELKFLNLKEFGLSGEAVRSMPLEKLQALSPVNRALSKGKAQPWITAAGRPTNTGTCGSRSSWWRHWVLSESVS